MFIDFEEEISSWKLYVFIILTQNLSHFLVYQYNLVMIKRLYLLYTV